MLCIYTTDNISQIVNLKAITDRDFDVIDSPHSIYTKDVPSPGEPRSGAVNFDTYRNLQRHRAVLTAIARLSCTKVTLARLFKTHCKVCDFVKFLKSFQYF